MAIKLSDICDVRDGTHDSPRYVDSGFPLVTSKNIINGKIDLSVVNYLSQEDYDKINQRSKVDIGDIIMPMIGTIGNPCLIEDNCDFAIKNVALIKFPDKKVINKFIWYFLKSKAFIRYVEEKNRGGTQKFISLSDIRSIIVPELPISQQYEIIEKLDKLQSIITHRQKQLEKLDELIKSRFVEMFGDVVSNNMNWNSQPMSKVAPSKPYKETLEGNVWLLNLDMVESQTGRIIDYLYVDKTEVGNSTNAFDEGNVLYSKLRPYLNKVVVPNQKGYATTELVPLRPNELLNRNFFAYLLRSDCFVSYINEKVAGAKMPRVSMDVFREFKCILPPLDLQNQFADFVKQVDKSKAAVQKALDEAQLLFDSLMQKYFG